MKRRAKARAWPLLSICFFLNTGRTYTFRDAAIEHDNETAIKIRYESMSDGRTKEATFYKTHVVGVATCWRSPS
jgi:hypothetical protein